MGRDLYQGLKASHLSGDFNLFAHYNGDQNNSPDGRLMSIHMAMEMLLDHPDLVVESAMRYEETHVGTGSEHPHSVGSKYAYTVWQDGLLDDVFDTPKADLLHTKVEDFLGFGNKTLIYTKYRTGLPYLQDLFPEHKAVLYHGQMNAKQKAFAIEQFTGEYNLFLSSWAGAYGCDMNMARHLVNFDNPWSAGTADQINGRHVRLSTEFDKVYIHTMYFSDTIEERMLGQQGQKRKINKAVVDGQGADRMGRIDNSVQSLTSFLEETIDGL
jgi:SNF2 family DNA or RNA helicase